MSQRKRDNELFEYYSKLVAGEGGEDGEGSNKRIKPNISTEIIEINSPGSPGSPISEHLKGI
jgi:hypothetical protein